MPSSSEAARIARLTEIFGPTPIGVSLGIGDDCAVVVPRASKTAAPLVWTIDAQVEGTHFRRDWLTWEDVGWRSFMAAASDLAAMGASPMGALSALVLPPDLSDEDLFALAHGQAEAARAIGTAIIGGNLARGTPASVTTTLLGTSDAPILRSGARAGDTLWLGGPVGLAAAGLAFLERGLVAGEDPSVAACLAAWRRPMARLDLGAALVANAASAAVDVSDGLLRDGDHLALASRVSLVFEEALLRRLVDATSAAALVAASARLGRDPLDFALGGGEDYALLVTTAPSVVDLGSGFACIGRVEAARGGERLRIERADGKVEAVEARGFDHFDERSD